MGAPATAPAVASDSVGKRFFGPADRIASSVTTGGETFEMIVHLSPSNRLGQVKKDEIHRFFEGNRLEITTDIINTNLKELNWDAVIYVRNVARNDSGVGTLQWAPWCPTEGEPKLWLNDVSRMGNEKGAVSPIKIVMDQAKHLARSKGLGHLYLLVDMAGAGHNTLTSIYAKPNYGFSTNVAGCNVVGHPYTFMKAVTTA